MGKGPSKKERPNRQNKEEGRSHVLMHQNEKGKCLSLLMTGRPWVALTRTVVAERQKQERLERAEE